jgi:hypothetical protein
MPRATVTVTVAVTVTVFATTPAAATVHDATGILQCSGVQRRRRRRLVRRSCTSDGDSDSDGDGDGNTRGGHNTDVRQPTHAQAQAHACKCARHDRMQRHAPSTKYARRCDTSSSTVRTFCRLTICTPSWNRFLSERYSAVAFARLDFPTPASPQTEIRRRFGDSETMCWMRMNCHTKHGELW